MGEIFREAIIEAARDIATRLGVDTLRREDFFKESRFTQDQLNRLFPDDGWRGILEGADLRVTFQNTPTPAANSRLQSSRSASVASGGLSRSTTHGCSKVSPMHRNLSWSRSNQDTRSSLSHPQCASVPVRNNGRRGRVSSSAPRSALGASDMPRRMSKGWFICSGWFVPRLV